MAAERLGGANPLTRRWIVFVHQDGILLSPTIRALADLGILEPEQEGRSLADVCPDLPQSGFGYLRVGLRCLASQGWLAAAPTLEPETTILRWTNAGRSAARYWGRYVAAGRVLARFAGSAADAWSRDWDAAQTEAFLDLLPLACERWRLDPRLPAQLRALITAHLDAALVVPTMLWLRSTGRLAEDEPELPDGEAGRGMARLLTALGWRDGDSGTWTRNGREAAAVAVHFGMAASYLPLLARLPELYGGRLLVAGGADGEEWHVHRGLNVNASAAAHVRYFADADGIFLDLFSREPVADQPRFVADMGCGDGSWLVHLYRLIMQRTIRGQRLDTDPLLMVGLDYNAAALQEARRVLDEAGVPALLAPGDISDPDRVSSTLAEHGLRMDDGVHVRAFIDHDRSYAGAAGDVRVCGWSSGAYVDARGAPLAAEAVERDLVAHLQRWAPHVRKHGLVMLEAHCVSPRIARKHLGATHSVAFDAYHGYSHQFPIEHSAFLRCCNAAGLRPVSHCERRYPANRPFVAVSLNRLLVPERHSVLPASDPRDGDRGSWRPEPGVDLEDGRALHGLLYADGDLRYPRLWCSAATGFVVAGALEAVEARLADARAGDVIRVLDYGAGTGLAAIEFLKGCRERGIEQRLERLKVELEVHLVDLPSSWFAQGYELLRDCAWVRFHSLRATDGGFRPLLEITGGEAVDVVMANMVFHLVPHEALPRAASDLAGATTAGGRLVWSSPDLGPPGPYAVLFHDPNRALRQRWLQLLSGERSRRRAASGADEGKADGLPRLSEAVRQARAVDLATRRDAQARANRRVLPRANAAEDVARTLASRFAGPSTLELQTHEMLKRDILDTLLVPSNQAEYLSEIRDRSLREDVINELMLGEVLPEMQEQQAGTATGLNVQWTLGACPRA